ncbi:MAG: dehydrogenase [Micavibrio aeruginosavorus]|uniref:Dehydrogenase n=1 Tax=Micavibrio aeruginosavorus TaxID=349221 RepID=A0A2W5N3G2_9BACT|nr:MAG: dehydrogenase [Micavibrio aeruginosavorus]
MRVMVFVKATKDSEAGNISGPEMEKLFIDMGRYNQELIAAGIMKGGDGLKPTSHGKRVKFDGASRTVVDGPFTKDVNELVAGFWIWNVKDMNEAVEWVKKCPNPMLGPSEIEIRPFYEMEDFIDVLTPEAEKLHKRG